MKSISFFFLLILTSSIGYTQKMTFSVDGAYTHSITKEKLTKAQTMTDLKPGYPSSWISESDYITAEIQTSCDGDLKKQIGSNENLTEDQKSILLKADLGEPIMVEVKYNYKNSVTEVIEIKTINFAFTLIPDIEAKYIRGNNQMVEYFKANGIDNFLSKYQFPLATITFTIDKQGKVTDCYVSQSSEDGEIDRKLLKLIQNMPMWIPAQLSDGSKVPQVFEFSIGNFVGC